MKRFVLAALLAFSASFAHAAPATDAQIDRLLEVMRARQLVEGMLPQMEAMQQQMVEQMSAGQSLTAEQKKDVEGVLSRTHQRMREVLSWKNLQPLYRDIYRQTFTGEDMDALIGFYSSPAGQKLLEKMPQLMQNTMGAVQKMVAPMIEQLQQDLAAELQRPDADAGTD